MSDRKTLLSVPRVRDLDNMPELAPRDDWDYAQAIKRFCEETGISKSNFGREYAHDPRFVFDIEKGRRLKPDSRESLFTFIWEWMWTREEIVDGVLE